MGKDCAIVATMRRPGRSCEDEYDLLFQRDITDRGINYWESGSTQRRLLFAAGAYLQAVDAKTGKLITTFGTNGVDCAKARPRSQVDHRV